MLERIENHTWTHLLLCPLPVIYGEPMIYFYKNFKVLEDETVNTEVRVVNLVIDAKLQGEIYSVLMDGFDTYVRRD